MRHDEYLVGVKKGTILPISISRIVVTSEDFQVTCESTLYYGDNTRASFNNPIGRVNVIGLPRKLQGEAKLKFIFTIDIYGKLRVKFYSLDNGQSDHFSTDVNGLLSTLNKTEENGDETG